MTSTHSLLTVAALLTTLLPLAACTVDVREDEPSGRKAEVDIKTPVGSVSVRTDGVAPDTGLRTYPGARLLNNEENRPESANVNVSSSWFGVKVAAASFESADAQQKIVDFYRNELKAYGDVTECRGDIDFEGRRGSKKPVCDEEPSSRDIQLVAGTEESHRVVAVKPRGGAGSEFALVYIQTRGTD